MATRETITISPMDTVTIDEGELAQEGASGIIRVVHAPIVGYRGRRFQLKRVTKRGIAWDLETLEEVYLDMTRTP